MIAPAILAAVLCAPQVRLAPDQPLSYAFSDEPVIVEFRGDHDLDFDVMMVYGTGQFPSNSHGLGPIALRAGRPYWVTTNLEPVRFGTYTITMNLQWPQGSEEYNFHLQRIRRPAAGDPPPIMVRIPPRRGPWAIIRRVLPATRVSIDSTHPELKRLLAQFEHEGVSVRVILRGDVATLPADLAPASVAIPADGTPEEWERTARRIRDRFPGARTVLESPSPEFLVALLQSGAVQLINAISVESVDALKSDREAAERQGYESLPFSVHVASTPDLARAGEAWNTGAYVAEFDLDSVWSDNDLTPEFAMLNAMIHLCDGTRVAGVYVDGELHSIIFRGIESDRMGHWIAPIEGPAGIAGAESYADDDGNADEAPSDDTAYALGNDPDVVLSAISSEVRGEAAALKGMTAIIDALPDDAGRAVDRLLDCDGTTSMRAEFFSLLRSMPKLEELWHGGTVQKSDAVPAMACIERLTVRLAALEQTLGVPFVEPLDETLDRCAEQQALYLTATAGPGASAERGEQLMMHVSTLITRARRYHEQGRVIEGDAIAALAEWRARSLVYAAKARPLTEAEPEPSDD